MKLLPCNPVTAAGALAAYGVLRAMSTVLESIHALPHLYAQASVKKLRFGQALPEVLVEGAKFCVFCYLLRLPHPAPHISLNKQETSWHVHPPNRLLLQMEDILFPILDKYTSTDGQDIFEEVRGQWGSGGL